MVFENKGQVRCALAQAVKASTPRPGHGAQGRGAGGRSAAGRKQARWHMYTPLLCAQRGGRSPNAAACCLHQSGQRGRKKEIRHNRSDCAVRQVFWAANLTCDHLAWAASSSNCSPGDLRDASWRAFNLQPGAFRHRPAGPPRARVGVEFDLKCPTTPPTHTQRNTHMSHAHIHTEEHTHAVPDGTDRQDCLHRLQRDMSRGSLVTVLLLPHFSVLTYFTGERTTLHSCRGRPLTPGRTWPGRPGGLGAHHRAFDRWVPKTPKGPCEEGGRV